MDERDEVLSLLPLEDFLGAVEAVDVYEKFGEMTPDEAAEWRIRIEAWWKFRTMEAAGLPS